MGVKSTTTSNHPSTPLRSCRLVNEAVHLALGCKSVLEKGGFNLTKYVSNSSDVLNAVPDDLASGVKMIPSDENFNTRALGIT